LNIPEVDFGECLQKIKNLYSSDESLIFIIITKKLEGKEHSKIIDFSINDPISGEKLPYKDICSNESLIVQDKIISKLINSNIDINYLKHLAEQNIDIFDLTSDFYTDICYEFDSPLPGNKDIPLKDRVRLFFPNISLCEDNCQIKGINMTTFKSICECKFDKIFNSDFFGNNFLIKNEFKEIENTLKSTNIEVLKCYKSIFIYKYFISCTGGFLIMGLIIIQVVLTIIYYYNNFHDIKRYIFNISEKYISYLYNTDIYDKKYISNNEPPQRKRAKRGEERKKMILIKK
jgi:hypothetical protein